MKKVHQKQMQFYKDKARNRWIFGGNRTGKTHAGAQEAVWWACCSEHPRKKNWDHNKTLSKRLAGGTEGWVVSLSTQVQRDVAQKKILELLDTEKVTYSCVMQSGTKGSPKRGVIDFITVTRKDGTESRIGFKNCEQGCEKFQGAKLDWVWFDEEPSEDIYEECLMRVMDKKGYVWGTMTPLKGRTWIYDRVYMGSCEKISLHTMSWEDNPYLDQKEIERMEKNYSEEALESRKHGRFASGGGLVFKEFTEKNIAQNVSISLILETAVYTGISIDPGYTNPTAVLWFAIDGDSNIFVIADYKEAGKSVEQIANDIYYKSKQLGVGIKNIYIDTAAAARTLGEPRSVAEQFRACGIPVNTQVHKNVNEGLHKVKALFCSAGNVRKLFVFESCTHLIKELRSYFWRDNETPHKSNDHCIDALRYFVMSAVVPGNELPKQYYNKQKKTLIEKFKRRLMNEKK